MRQTTADNSALVRLVLAGGRSAPRRRLLDRFATPTQALAAGPCAWHQCGCDAAQTALLQAANLAKLETTLHWCDTPGHHVIGWHAPEYPPLLRQIANPPLALFVDGNPDLLWHPAIAVVGSRNPTSGGRDNAKYFASALTATGLGIVSGMAAGIDAIAHAAALTCQDAVTVAVVGTGPDLAYPAHHHTLRSQIAAHGAVVSEYVPGTAALAGHFPARNRLIAGLSLGTLVIEAAMRSGALITARLATEAGREVFAVPGSLHNPLARGCHHLIRQGAVLVQEPADLIEPLRPLSQTLAEALQQRLNVAADPSMPPAKPTIIPANADSQRVWHALAYDPSTMDALIERTGLTAAALSSMLLVMELEGKVTVEHGRYVRNP